MRCQQAAKQGNAEAQFHLAEKYELGQGVPQSKPIAMEWYKKSAAQKYPAAQTKVEAETDKITCIKLAAEANGRAAIAARAGEQAKLDTNAKIRADAEQARIVAGEKAIAQAKADAEAKRIKLVKIPATAKVTAQITTPNKVVKAEVVHPTQSSPKILVERSLMDWAAAWSNKNVHDDLSTYAYYFKPKGLSHDAWKKQRAECFSKPKIIEVSLSNIAINVQDENHVSVTFIQHYRSDDYHDEVEK